MHCKYCNETDETKLTMSTRMINGKALTFDVCFSCQWREKFEAGREVMGKEMVKGMRDGKILSKEDWKYIYEDRDFLEFLKKFYKR